MTNFEMIKNFDKNEMVNFVEDLVFYGESTILADIKWAEEDDLPEERELIEEYKNGKSPFKVWLGLKPRSICECLNDEG